VRGEVCGVGDGGVDREAGRERDAECDEVEGGVHLEIDN